MRRVVLFLLALSLTGCAARQVPPQTKPLRVLVYNIHAGKDAGGADNLARVADLVTMTHADIVLLQEVDVGTTRSGGVDQLEALRRLTGHHGAFGRTLDFQGGQYGIAVLSRWPIQADSMISLPVVPAQARAGGSYEPRGALHVTVAHPDGPVHVLNTHLDPGKDPHYRRQEIAGIRGALERIHTAGRPVFFGGDLNATPDDSAIASLATARLRDSWMVCPGIGPSGTFPAAGPVKRIDYLWISETVRCSVAVVLASEVSDHRPLLVTLTIPRKRGRGFRW